MKQMQSQRENQQEERSGNAMITFLHKSPKRPVCGSKQQQQQSLHIGAMNERQEEQKIKSY